MANVAFKKGLLANLPAAKEAGTFYVTVDERAIYLDVDGSNRIRLGDFQEFATVAELEANVNPSTTALYYVVSVNCLAKWNGTSYVQINMDTGATSIEVVGDGNAVTAATYNAETRKITLTKGTTFAGLGADTDASTAITLYGVKKYAQEQAAAVLGADTDTSSANTVYGAKALANEKVGSVTAGNNGVEIGGTATAPTVGLKLSAKTGNDLSIETGSGEEGLYFHQAAAPVIAVQEKASPNTGYLKTYQVTVDGTPVSIDIDIPKDFLVKSATSGVVTAADKASGGKFEDNDDYSIGDAYLDFVINTVDGSATDEHVYVNVANLVDVYTNGNGLNLSNNEFSIKIDATNANGLAVDASGLKLGLATPDTYVNGTKTADGDAGAMSSADKYKLNNIAAGAQVNVLEGVQVDGSDLTIDANKKVNIVCNTAYNASTNKIATMADISDAAMEWGSF